MKNDRKISKILMIVLILAVLSLMLIVGTYAKYTTKLTSNNTTAIISKWAWTIGTEDINSGTTTFSFNLFGSILDTVDSNAEDNVVSNKIAPGTKGSVEITIANKSDVDATYAITFEETNPLNANIKYSLDGTTYGDISSLNISTTEIAKTTGIASKTIYWKWEFDGNDTQVGFKAGTVADATVTVLATLDLMQVD